MFFLTGKDSEYLDGFKNNVDICTIINYTSSMCQVYTNYRTANANVDTTLTSMKMYTSMEIYKIQLVFITL